MKLIKIYSLLVFTLLSTFLVAQHKVEFKNSTPKETVESHFNFLKGNNYNPKIASHTLGNTGFSENKNEILVIRLKEILEKYELNIDDVLDRKKGIVENNKYLLFSRYPKLYLVRIKRGWYYSEETVKSINSIYNSVVLHRNNEGVNNGKEIATENVFQYVVSDSSSAYKFNISTPYDAVLTHLIYTTDSLFDPVKAAKTIHFSQKDSAKSETLAIKLSQIFLASSKKMIDFDHLSKDSNFVDSVSQKHIFYPNPDVPKLYLEKVGDDWMYSLETSKLINSIHKEMFSDGAEEIFKFSDKFKRWAGHDYKRNVFGIDKWKWVMLIYFFSLLFLIWILSITLLKWGIKKIKYIKRYHKVYYTLIKNATFLWYLQASETYIPSIEFPVEYSVILHKIVGISIVYFTTFLILNLVNFAVLVLTRDGSINHKKGVVVFSSLMIKILVIIGGVLYGIHALEYDLVNVLTGLSIGGFAIALGAQDTVKNFFGSLMIFADQPFAVGDFITDGKIMGTVEEVGLRTTKVRTAYNSVVTLPNSMLSDNSVDNWGKREYRRYKSKIILDYNVSSDTIQKFIELLKKEVLAQEKTRKDYFVITVNDFSLYGVEVLINIFFITPTWGEEMIAREKFVIRTLEIAKELEIIYAKPPR